MGQIVSLHLVRTRDNERLREQIPNRNMPNFKSNKNINALKYKIISAIHTPNNYM